MRDFTETLGDAPIRSNEKHVTLLFSKCRLSCDFSGLCSAAMKQVG